MTLTAIARMTSPWEIGLLGDGTCGGECASYLAPAGVVLLAKAVDRHLLHSGEAAAAVAGQLNADLAHRRA